MSPEALDGWIPSRIHWQSGEPLVEWRWLGERCLTDPFFNDSLNHALRSPFALLFRHVTPIGTLQSRAEIRPGLKPAGLIFHLSRCGSTLVSQVLSASPAHVVISEAPVLDALLRGGRRVEPEERVRWIRWAVHAVGQKRAGYETRCFIKLDCWHVEYLPILQAAFPDVPWIFLYRDPLEVLASHEAVPALWRVPGMLDSQRIGLDLAAARFMHPLEYCARLLRKTCEEALAFRSDPLGRFVNYSELPQAIWSSIGNHFGLSLSSDAIVTMQAKARFNAKSPEIHFENDCETKRHGASSQAVAIAERWLAPVFERLEQARAEQSYQTAAGTGS